MSSFPGASLPVTPGYSVSVIACSITWTVPVPGPQIGARPPLAALVVAATAPAAKAAAIATTRTPRREAMRDITLPLLMGGYWRFRSYDRRGDECKSLARPLPGRSNTAG